MVSTTFILAGLGNKGSRYDNTRHNIGFTVIDELARRWGVRMELEKWNSMSGCVQLSGNRIFFLKPMTFMNLSGRGVSQFAQFYKIGLDHILVIHDDLDMAPGRIKLVKGGGAGGHKGIISLAEHLGGRDFFRLKVGIGRPGQGGVHSDFPVEKYVLGTIGEPDISVLESRFNAIEDGVRLFFENGPARAMSTLNSLK